MNKFQLFENYGHIQMQYMEEGGLYYFENTVSMQGIKIIVVTEFVPEDSSPTNTIPLIECDSGNIVGAIIDKELMVYDYTYTIPLEDKRKELYD